MKPEMRVENRLTHISPVRIEDIISGINYNAEMVNCSKNGLYFETDSEFQPGTEIFIGIKNSPYASNSGAYECYRAEVRWRKKLKSPIYDYGYGVKIIFINGRQLSEHDDYVFKDVDDLRKHPRKRYTKTMFFAAQGRICEGLIKNISSAGVFIKTKDTFTIGQILTLAVPAKRGKQIKIEGRVVWSDNEGFGFRFLRKIENKK